MTITTDAPPSLSGWLSGGGDPRLEQNVRHPAHLVAAVVYGGIAAIGANSDLEMVFLCLLMVAFGAIAVSVLRNLGWVLLAAAVGAIPVVGWLVALYFVITRWEFIREHKGAVLTSFGMYTAPYLIAAMFREAPLIALVAGAALWHGVSMRFYRRGYSATSYLKVTALGPVLVLLLILPFLDFDADFGDVDADLDVDHAGSPAGTGDPGYEYVDSHVRTVADGNPLNNLSHPGGPVQAPPELIEVDGYIRTVADGDPANNLGASAVPPTSPGALPVDVEIQPSPTDGLDGLLTPDVSSAVAAGAAVAAASWYGDPLAPHRIRYWDGEQWTSWVSDNGQAPYQSPVR